CHCEKCSHHPVVVAQEHPYRRESCSYHARSLIEDNGTGVAEVSERAGEPGIVNCKRISNQALPSADIDHIKRVVDGNYDSIRSKQSGPSPFFYAHAEGWRAQFENSSSNLQNLVVTRSSQASNG